MKTLQEIQSLGKLYKKRGRIDLDPDFQREKVWKKARKQLFIDTILKGWGIPKIYLLLLNKDDSNKNYACVDGKQRLLSIFEFMSNEYPTSIDTENPSISEKKYSELPETISDKFDDYVLSIEEVSEAKPEEISELFKRLQLGVPLNSGEKLMAVDGYLKDKIKSISEHDFFKNKVMVQNTRYSHFVVCAQITFLEVNGLSNLSLNKLEEFIRNNNNKSSVGYLIEEKLKKIVLVLDYLNKIFTNKSDILKNRATIVSLYLFISKFMDATNIDKKESKFRNFFEAFSKDLNKQISLGTEATDPKLVNYQNSVIQGADKQKAIKNRDDILMQKLPEYDQSLYELLHPKFSMEDKFKELYSKFEKKLKTEEAINNWIIQQNKSKNIMVKCKSSRLKNGETLPVHIRNCINHKPHGKFTTSQIKKSIEILNDIESSLVN